MSKPWLFLMGGGIRLGKGMRETSGVLLEISYDPDLNLCLDKYHIHMKNH